MSSPTMSVSGDELLSETQLQKVYLMLDDEEVTDKLGFAEFRETLDATLRTASSPRVQGEHLVRAIATLSHILWRLNSELSRYHQRVHWEDGYWVRLFDVVLVKSASTPPKIMKRLSIPLTLEVTGRAACGGDISGALSAMVAPLLSQADRGKTKPALQILEETIGQKLVPIADIARALFVDMKVGGDRPSETYKALFRKLFEWATQPELTNIAGRAVSRFWTRLRSELQISDGMFDGNVFPLVWIDPLVEVLARSPESIPRFKAHVFRDLFLIDLSDFKILLKTLGFYGVFPRNPEPNTEVQLFDVEIRRTILFGILDAAKKIGIVSDSDEHATSLKEGEITIHPEYLQSLLIDESSFVRVGALSLAISSSTTSTPYPEGHLTALQNALPGLVIESDAGLRWEILGLFQRLVDRLRTATHSQERRRLQTEDPETQSSIDRLLASHEHFVLWLIEFLYRQLHPGARYQKVIFSLRMLKMLSKSGLDPRLEGAALPENWGFSCAIMTPKLIRTLLALTMNSFEDVRTAASELLQIRFDESPFSANDRYLVDCLEIAEATMLKSGRADHADGVSQLYSIAFRFASHTKVEPQPRMKIGWWKEKPQIILHLIRKLDGALQQARDKRALAISASPLHGVISSIRHILNSPDLYAQISELPDSYRMIWSDIHVKICVMLVEVWDIVQFVLCNDAPEGHVPQELEDVHSLSTKDVLSYSWRALAETSALIRVVALKTPLSPGDENGIIPFERLVQLTNLTFTALTDLRHRGAFSAVALAFDACCRRYQKEKKEPLLVDLYQRSLDIIQDKGSAITRRSAGIPSIVVGVLSANPEAPLFARAMKELQEQAALPIANSKRMFLPQVHALNTLKAIFSNSILGDASEQCVPDCLVLASKCLVSDMWAIRNCGLMLFRALVDRLLGSLESHNSVDTKHKTRLRFSWDEHPVLEGTIHRLIDAGMDESVAPLRDLESVFPALKMIQSIPPAEASRDYFCRAMLKLSQSSHLHIRDVAAGTYCNLTKGEDFFTVLRGLLHGNNVPEDEAYGRLHCVSYLVRSHLSGSGLSSRDLIDVWNILHQTAPVFFWRDNCPCTKSAYLQILNKLESYSLQHNNHTLSMIDDGSQPLWRGVAANSPSDLLKEAELYRLLVGIHLDHEGATDISNLVRLAGMDATACASVLEELMPLLPKLPGVFNTSVAIAMWQIIENVKNNDLLYMAGMAICQIIDRLDYAPATAGNTLQSVQRNQATNPEMSLFVTEAAVRLWSKHTQHSFTKLAVPPAQFAAIDRNLLQFRHLLGEEMPFTLRLSVVQALQHLSCMSSLPESRASRAVGTKLVFLLYDCLNDDVEEIREMAARVVCELDARSPPGSGVVPLNASNVLLGMIASKKMHSKRATDEATARLTLARYWKGALWPKPNLSPHVVLAVNADLFAVEKQNLYIDHCRESTVWAVVLRNFVPSQQQFEVLECWTLSGLRSANGTVLCLRDRNVRDGPLGWSSKPESFLLVARILDSADVILCWARALERETEVRRVLSHFASNGERNQLNEMLLAKAQTVLERNTFH